MTTETRENLFLRDDTFFGVCEGLGEITRIPSNLFRLALAPLLIWNPMATFVGYCAVGLVIASIRFVFPKRQRVSKPKAIVQTAAAPVAAQPAPVVEQIELAKAA